MVFDGNLDSVYTDWQMYSLSGLDVELADVYRWQWQRELEKIEKICCTETGTQGGRTARNIGVVLRQ